MHVRVVTAKDGSTSDHMWWSACSPAMTTTVSTSEIVEVIRSESHGRRIARSIAAVRSSPPPGFSMADAIREVAPIFAPLITQVAQKIAERPAQPRPAVTVAGPAPRPAALPVAASPTASVPAATPVVPPADPVAAAMNAAFDRLIPVLAVGAKIKGDPALWAEVLDSAFEAEEIDLDGTLAAFPEGELARMLAERSGFDAEWLVRVENELRNPGTEDDGSDEGADDVAARLDRTIRYIRGEAVEPDVPFEPNVSTPEAARHAAMNQPARDASSLPKPGEIAKPRKKGVPK